MFGSQVHSDTPTTPFAMADYPNGQFAFFNVRNVNYKGYQRQVENEYYFEDGGRIIRGTYFPKGSDKGEKVKVPGGKVTPVTAIRVSVRLERSAATNASGRMAIPMPTSARRFMASGEVVSMATLGMTFCASNTASRTVRVVLVRSYSTRG